jgi:hypothetical protein
MMPRQCWDAIFLSWLRTWSSWTAKGAGSLCTVAISRQRLARKAVEARLVHQANFAEIPDLKPTRWKHWLWKKDNWQQSYELENGNRTGRRISNIRRQFVAKLKSSLGKSR